jgi:hypothetical protein
VRRGGHGVLAVPFSLVFFLSLVIPTMLVVLPLRLAGVLSWRVEAVTYPWGQRKPADVKAWRVKGIGRATASRGRARGSA